jgi:hypothetical protein
MRSRDAGVRFAWGDSSIEVKKEEATLQVAGCGVRIRRAGDGYSVQFSGGQLMLEFSEEIHIDAAGDVNLGAPDSPANLSATEPDPNGAPHLLKEDDEKDWNQQFFDGDPQGKQFHQVTANDPDAMHADLKNDPSYKYKPPPSQP